MGTITDDDGPPALSDQRRDRDRGRPGHSRTRTSRSASTPRERAGGRPSSYVTDDGTAHAPGDYQAGERHRLTFAAGQTTGRPSTVLVNGDTARRGERDVFVNLARPDERHDRRRQGVGTIIDDDGEPSLSIDDVSVNEGNSGSNDATFTVTLAPTSGQTVTVDYATADGTAHGRQRLPGRRAARSRFLPGEQTIEVRVPVFGDTSSRRMRRTSSTSRTPVSALLERRTGPRRLIRNDDAPPPPPPPPPSSTASAATRRLPPSHLRHRRQPRPCTQAALYQPPSGARLIGALDAQVARRQAGALLQRPALSQGSKAPQHLAREDEPGSCTSAGRSRGRSFRNDPAAPTPGSSGRRTEAGSSRATARWSARARSRSLRRARAPRARRWRRPRHAQTERPTASAIASGNAKETWSVEPGIRLRPASRNERRRVDARDRVQPAVEQRQRHVDGREEERQEDRAAA